MRRRGGWVILVIVIILQALAISVAEAQIPITQRLDSGTVTRLTWNDGTRKIGRLLTPLHAGSDRIEYCPYPGPACIGDDAGQPAARAASELRRVEVQQGDRAGRGALIGAVTGLAIVVLGRSAFADADSPSPTTGSTIAGGLTVVALAAGIGALIGRGSTRWVTSP
jgi:hypothetical protein